MADVTSRENPLFTLTLNYQIFMTSRRQCDPVVRVVRALALNPEIPGSSLALTTC